MNMTTNCYPYPWDPELERLRRELEMARIEDEKRRIRRELDRLRPCVPCVPFTPWPFPSPVIWQPTFPFCGGQVSIQDVLNRIPKR